METGIFPDLLNKRSTLMPHPVLEKLAELFPDNELEHEWADEDIGQNAMSQLDNIFTILDGMKNHSLTFDNEIIRKILQCVIVESKDRIKVVFIGGLEVEAKVEQ